MRSSRFFSVLPAALYAVLAAMPAIAQDLTAPTEEVETCLGSAKTLPDREACIGTAAAICIDTPNGSTTVGMGFCFSAEAAFWDQRLNTAFAALMTLERRTKAELEGNGAFAPDAPAALRDMQRAWIGYRDATCAYEYTQWGGGTGGGPAHAACLMHETGRQALLLEDRLSHRQSQ